MSFTNVNLAHENTVDECSLRLDLLPVLIAIQDTKKNKPIYCPFQSIKELSIV